MKLAEMQSRFQASVLDEAPAEDFLRQLRPPARAEKIEDTFAVYHDGYRLRMGEFLANDYPVLSEALGDEDFGALVEAYFSARPSRYRNARWFGAALPEFMRATAPYSEDALARGLAALEAGLARSFDAADEAILPVEILGVTPQEDWPRLRFGFHPAVVLVETSAAALACYEAAQSEEEADPDGIGDEDVVVLFWRDGLDVHYRGVEPLEALALREALGGAPFGQICSLLAFARSDESAEQLTVAAAGFLANWFSGGLIVAAAPSADPD